MRLNLKIEKDMTDIIFLLIWVCWIYYSKKLHKSWFFNISNKSNLA